MTTFPLHEALIEFEDNLADIRAACVANAEDIIATYSPAKELDIDQPITKEAIHQHVNFLHVQQKLTPILNSIKRIDTYRYLKANPTLADRITDADIQQAKSIGEDWFISEANLSTKKPHVGFCFAHHDKNASLMLMKSKAKGTFYLKCFVCNEAWDSIGYIQKRDGLDFINAVRFIVNK